MFRFRMSGQLFEFDDDRPFTAAELFDTAEVLGISDDDDVAGILTGLAESVGGGVVTLRGAKAIVCLAWLAQRRGVRDSGVGAELDWRAFSAAMVVDTLELVDDQAPGDGGPQRQSATRQRPKGRKPKR